MNRCTSRAKARGFTLVELLVVVAIIALLAGLLLPVLSRSVSSSRSTACLNNLRQWALSTAMFIGDNEGYLPTRSPETDWLREMGIDPAQHRGALHCPEDRTETVSAAERTSKNDPVAAATGYLLNGFSDFHFEAAGDFSWREKAVRTPETIIVKPSRTILFGEKRSGSEAFYVDVLPVSFEVLRDVEESRHAAARPGDSRGRSNYAFADGSVRALDFGTSTCPENLWAVIERWRNDAVLCRPRF